MECRSMRSVVTSFSLGWRSLTSKVRVLSTFLSVWSKFLAQLQRMFGVLGGEGGMVHEVWCLHSLVICMHPPCRMFAPAPPHASTHCMPILLSPRVLFVKLQVLLCYSGFPTQHTHAQRRLMVQCPHHRHQLHRYTRAYTHALASFTLAHATPRMLCLSFSCLLA